jgi:hypothetical protein
VGARRAGNGVAVILARYANCLDGDESITNARISAAPDMKRGTMAAVLKWAAVLRMSQSSSAC